MKRCRTIWWMLLGLAIVCADSKVGLTGERLAPLNKHAPSVQFLKGAVWLRWSVKEWPKGLQGFRIIRTQLFKQKPGKTEVISDHLLKPDVTFQNARALKSMRIFKRLSIGGIREMPWPTYTAIPVSTFKLVQQTFWVEWDFMRCLGLAYVDRTAESGQEFSYSIVPVGDGFKRPLAVLKIQTKITAPPKLDARLEFGKWSDSDLQLSWQVNGKGVDFSKLRGFHVYRSLDQGVPIRISDYPFMPGRIKGQPLLKVLWREENVPAASNYRYGLRPMYRNEWGPFCGFTTVLRPLQELPIPKILTTKWKEKGIRVTWKFPNGYQFKGFQLIRSQFPNSDVVKNIPAEPLGSDLREFFDTRFDQKPGGQYQYRVKVLSGDSRFSPRSARGDVAAIPKPEKELPVPRAFIAKNGVENKEAGIRISWNAEGNPKLRFVLEDLTKGSEEWSERRIFKPGINFGFIEVIPVQTVSLRLRYLNEDGEMGAPSPAQTVLVAGENRPPEPWIENTKKEMGGVRLKWSLPEVAGIAGFRIFGNGKLIVDEKVLDGSKMEYLLRGFFNDNKNVELGIQSVSSNGMASELKLRPLSLGRPGTRAGIPAPPSTSLFKKELKSFKHEVSGVETSFGVGMAKGKAVAHKGIQWLHGPLALSTQKRKPQASLNYDKGKMHGVQRWFGLNGEIQVVMLFKEGLPVSSANFESTFEKIELSPKERAALIQP